MEHFIALVDCEHEEAPAEPNVVRARMLRAYRIVETAPGVCKLSVTTQMDVRGSIPRKVNTAFMAPALSVAPLNALRFFVHVKDPAGTEAADAKVLGQLLVLDMDNVRLKRDKRRLEVKLRTFVDRTAVLREARRRFPWIETLLVEVLRNQVHRPSHSLTPLAEFGEEEGRKVGGTFGLIQLKKASPAAAVEAWISGNPALGDLTRE
jgi:hypothetical protein